MKIIETLFKLIISLMIITILVLTIKIELHEVKENKYSQYDVNQDGETNTLDMLILQKYLLEKRTCEN